MKNYHNHIRVTAILFLLIISACKKSFLDQPAQGAYNQTDVLTAKGINGLLINAYADLDGNGQIDGLGESDGADNWIYGGILGGDAYKGGVSFGDQSEINPIMQYVTPLSNPHILTKWKCLYDGIGRANLVLKTLPKITDPAVTADQKKQIEAEARFIRGFQNFEAKKVFNNVPFVDENATDYKIPNIDANGNYVDIWPNIETDLKFAYDNLDAIKPGAGRANKWAAGAFLAKAYLYQHKFTDAKALFDILITQGATSTGQKYALENNFEDNFRIATQNGKEAVFSLQENLGDGSTTNGNLDYLLTYPNGIAGGTNSWYFRPSQNLVNAFRTDATGLPFLDTYNDTDVTPFENVTDDQPFTPYQGNLDPRLDWTVGRRGIPYLDWGIMTGIAFTAPPGESITNGGAYCGKKQVFSKAELNAGLAGKSTWYFNSALNFTPMRYADLLLMAAECELEVGSLEKARDYVNQIRDRAGRSPVKTLDGKADAANYKVALYTSPWASKDVAMKAVRFERRLELGHEGHRFFDLVRWGIADQVIRDYLAVESKKRPLLFTNVNFTKGRSEYQPIPLYVITQSNKDGKPTLKQNPGY
jgi:hypothetical protein